MLAPLNPAKIGHAARAFAGAVHPEDAAPVSGSRRSGGRKPQSFNFKRYAKGERMKIMRQAARRP